VISIAVPATGASIARICHEDSHFHAHEKARQSAETHDYAALDLVAEGQHEPNPNTHVLRFAQN